MSALARLISAPGEEAASLIDDEAARIVQIRGVVRRTNPPSSPGAECACAPVHATSQIYARSQQPAAADAKARAGRSRDQRGTHQCAAAGPAATNEIFTCNE